MTWRFACVQVDQRIQQLIGPGDHLTAWKWSGLLGNSLGQIYAADKLHHQKSSIAFGKIVADARQCRMMY